MSEEELAELERLAGSATPGPWKVGFSDEMFVSIEPEVAGGWEGGILNDADAEYIAATNPDTLLRLIGEVRELRRHLST